MAITLKPGTRLFSAVDATEMIAVKAPADAIELTLGGVPAVLSADARGDGAPQPGHDGGVAMGKRYTDAAGTLELRLDGFYLFPTAGHVFRDGVDLASTCRWTSEQLF